MIQSEKRKIRLKRKDKDGNPIYREVVKYRYRVTYTTSTGERKRKSSKYYDTQKEAIQAEAEFLTSHKNITDSSHVRFFDLYQMYKTDSIHNNEESGTLTKLGKIDKHILPFFKNLLISDITPLTIRKWQIEMMSKTYGPNKKHYALSFLEDLHSFLATILEYGIKYYGLSQNPARIQGNFKMKKSKMNTNDADNNFYTYDEFKQFIKYVDDETKPFFRFLYFTGCRYGEAIALNWNDLNKTSISVTKSLTRKTNEGLYKIKAPKNQSSVRDIELPIIVIEDLNNLKAKQEQMYGFSNNWFIFGATRPLSDTTIRRKANQAMDKAGLKRITLHGFRHSHASLLINGNMNIKLISNRLGHANVTETLNTYTHMFPDQNEICVKYLDSLYMDEKETN
jgi:integrase